jgi:hypothetical protein
MPIAPTTRERGGSGTAQSPVTCSSFQAARAALIEYVLDNWQTEIGDKRPVDEHELVDMYSTDVPEAYEITDLAAWWRPRPRD